MYTAVKSMVKNWNQLSDLFNYMLGVRQGESLSLWLFAMFLDDLLKILLRTVKMLLVLICLRFFIILYTGDIVIFANTSDELQQNLDTKCIWYGYCKKWKLIVNTATTKIWLFAKVVDNDTICLLIIENVKHFTPSWSFSEAQQTLAEQALKAIS